MSVDEPTPSGPSSSFYFSQRLKLHYLDWGNPDKPPLLLIHGGRDHARNWDWVARELRGDFHVIVPDLRGHGDSSWALGGNYALTDFVLDIANLLDALELCPVSIIGHSLGGAISLQYAGVYPERVQKLVAIEGLGPSPDMIARMRGRSPWERMQGWIIQMRELAARLPRRYPTAAAAAARMQEVNPFLAEEQAHHLTIHGVNRNEDGTFSWKFDNYVRATAPYRFDVEDMRALWHRIECPTLLVRGGDSWASDPVKDGRIQPFRKARALTISGAGHWVHHDQLDVFLRAVRTFLLE
jgi:pimeloyl-ACP methyl ester carboxylesterase